MIRLFAFLFALVALPVFASPPIVVAVEATPTGMGWDFSVTLEHADTGWDHYADGWEVLDADGAVLGYRKLHHPHVYEQPFTRSLTDVMVPDGVRKVFIRVRCSRHGWDKELYEVLLER